MTSDAAGFDSGHPQIARIYDYLLGGKDNFAADREVGDRIVGSLPSVLIGVRAQREVLSRVVRYLVGEAGVRQLLDIGSGLPTAENVHQVAQDIDPGTRVVYLDNDPMVVRHAQALLADDDTTFAALGDLRDPSGVLASPQVRSRFDWGRPVGLILCGIMYFIPDDERPADLLTEYYDALPSGSYVFIHHLLRSAHPGSVAAEAELRQGLGRAQFRTLDEVRALFGGLELVPPGLVPVPDWRPDPATPSPEHHPVLRLACAGLARKP